MGIIQISVYIYGTSLSTNCKLWKVAAQSEWAQILFLFERRQYTISKLKGIGR